MLAGHVQGPGGSTLSLEVCRGDLCEPLCSGPEAVLAGPASFTVILIKCSGRGSFREKGS